MASKDAIHDLTMGRFRRDANGNIELTEPELLYQNVASAKHYLRAMKNKTYAGGFHADSIELIKAHLPLFYPSRNVRLFDLGPGYPDKMLPVIAGAKDAGVKLSYFPVDVSEMYLEVAAMAAEEYLSENQIFRLHRRFEEMAALDIPNPDGAANIYNLGPTIMNFPRRYGSALLGRMMKHPDDVAVVTYETITAKNPIEKILTQYQGEEVREFTFGPLKNLGFHMEQTDYSATFNAAAGRIECAHTFKNLQEEKTRDEGLSKADIRRMIMADHPFSRTWEKTIADLDDVIKGDIIFFRPGQKAITAVSYRNTAAGWKRGLKRDFEEVTTYTSESGSTILAFLKGPKVTRLPELHAAA